MTDVHGPPPGPDAPEGWYPDPTGHHAKRYWDGTSWTSVVADKGVQGNDTPDDPRWGRGGVHQRG